MLAMLLAMIAPRVTASAQGTGTITGTVVEQATGRPIPDAMVIVAGTPVGSRTGENGSYRITGVSAGPIQLRVARLGYSAATQTITVGAAHRPQ